MKTKYTEITKTYLFLPPTFETMGPISGEGHEFISDLGHRISVVIDDPRKSCILFTRISVTFQRFIAV
jgi:hypothetical protein